MIKMIVLDDQVPGVDHHVFLVHLPPPVVFGLRHFDFRLFSVASDPHFVLRGLSKAHESARALPWCSSAD